MALRHNSFNIYEPSEMKPKCGANLNQGDSEQKTERKGMESGKEKIQEIQAPKIQMT